MKIRNNFIIATALVATISLTSCSSTNTNLAQEGVFIVGMECAYQPFNWTEISSTESTTIPMLEFVSTLLVFIKIVDRPSSLAL